MAQQQSSRYRELRSLSARLARCRDSNGTQLIERMDRIVEEAAEIRRINTPAEAVASLEIALHAMGADRKHPTPHERLIMQAVAFLQMLALMAGTYQGLSAPCIGGHGAIISRTTGIG